MCFLKIVKTKSGYYIYKIKINKISQSDCIKHINNQMRSIHELVKFNIITTEQAKYASKVISNWKLQRLHAVANFKRHDTITNKTHDFYFGITKSENDVIIIKSLSENYLGEKDQLYKVIKISDGLYITSHSLIPDVNLTELKYGELIYNPLKKVYIDIDKHKITPFNNLTKENVEKMTQIIIEHIESTEIKKVDISNAADVVNDVAVFKYLQAFKNGTFDKATYEEIGLEMDKIDNEFMQIDRYIEAALLKSPEL